MGLYGTGLYGAGTYGLAPVWPTFTLEWAPASGPLVESPAWVDITDRLLEWEWSYGRNDETGEFEAGQGSLLLDSKDRAFDPSYTAGPWYGNIKPRRQFRMTTEWAGVTYPVFRAHARGFPQQYPSETNKTVRVQLADLLALLQAVDLDALGFNRPPELSTDRLDAVLDEADIPAGFRDYDPGENYVFATDDLVEVGSANSQLRAVEWTEGPPVYVNRSGNIAY